MTSKAFFILPVSDLPYAEYLDETQDWQDQRPEYVDKNPVTQESGNRFRLGYTAFFDDFSSLYFPEEACKAILPEIYAWLAVHAPNAMIEVNEYNLDYDSEVYTEDESYDEEIGVNVDEDGNEIASSGDVDVFVNFAADKAAATAFALLFMEKQAKAA